MADHLYLIYDKQCPFCDKYCQLVRIRDAVGELTIIDAREDSEIMQEITQAGLDIDQGMVLKINGTLHYGSDAIHMLGLLSSRCGFFNRINYWLFRSKLLSKLLYPLLRAGRNFALKLMGKTRINNLGKENNERF